VIILAVLLHYTHFLGKLSPLGVKKLQLLRRVLIPRRLIGFSFPPYINGYDSRNSSSVSNPSSSSKLIIVTRSKTTGR
jgi:hypothetical protein